MKPITQEHPMGCAVACTASLIGKSYAQTLILFSHPEYASTRGYYCSEICDVLNDALRKKNMHYTWKKVMHATKPLLHKTGVIVFIKRSKDFPFGHFLLRTEKGWMNPWINLPYIKPAKSGFQKSLPGDAQWIIFPVGAYY